MKNHARASTDSIAVDTATASDFALSGTCGIA
jgi:hypothetical protein